MNAKCDNSKISLLTPELHAVTDLLTFQLTSKTQEFNLVVFDMSSLETVEYCEIDQVLLHSNTDEIKQLVDDFGREVAFRESWHPLNSALWHERVVVHQEFATECVHGLRKQ